MKSSYRTMRLRDRVARAVAATALALVLLQATTPRTARADGVDPVVTADHVVTRHDRVPRVCNVPTVSALRAGPWSSASTWSTGAVPGAGARVRIAGALTVTYDLPDTAALECIEVGEGAVLRWDPTRSTRLEVADLQVLPGAGLVIGDAGNPIAPAATAEIVFADVPLDTAGRDPAQHGRGLHVFGAVRIHGAPLERTFLRLADDVAAGARRIPLEQVPAGWRPDDRLILPDTRHIAFRKNHVFTSQAEALALAAVDGDSVLLRDPLAHEHRGPRNADGDAGAVEQGMRPHLGNLTRNVVLRSVDLAESTKDRYCRGAENLDDHASCVTRGHVMLHARAAVDIRYAAFLHLGRTTVDELDNATFDESGASVTIGTNQVGRYAIHAHRLAGPVNDTDTGFQYVLVGNVIEGFLKWGLAVHETHYGLVMDNVLYDGEGSAVATEDGMESYNVFYRNFVVHTKAGDAEQIVEKPGRAGVRLTRDHFGFTRDGFWFSGMNNYVVANVVANAPGFAYNYNGYYLTPDQPIPDFRGADPATDSTVRTALPALLSVANEAYGAAGQGLWLTWSRGCCSVSRYEAVSLFKDFRIWHVTHSGLEAYHESRNHFDGFVLRNDPAVTAASQGGSLRFNRGLNFSNGSYENGQLFLHDMDVQGFNVGILLPPRPEDGTAEDNVSVLANSYLQNYVNVQETLPNIARRFSVLYNVVFEPLDIAPVPAQPATPTAIAMRYSVSKNTSFVDRHASTFVVDFNGVPGDSFQVFFEEQGPEYPIPPPPDIDHPNFHACPEPNLTNLECLTRHGIAIAGEVAPCITHDGDATCTAARQRATDLGIEGLVFPLP